MENGPFEDVSPIQDGDFPLLVYQRVEVILFEVKARGVHNKPGECFVSVTHVRSAWASLLNRLHTTKVDGKRRWPGGTKHKR